MGVNGGWWTNGWIDEVNTGVHSLLQVLEEPEPWEAWCQVLEPWEVWCQVQYQVQCQEQCQVCQALGECQVSCDSHPEMGLYCLIEETWR